jgi:hypothetical protein
MPDFTIHLSHQAIHLLQAVVKRANDTNGTNLTLRAWLQLHAEEIAVADKLAAAVQALQQQEEAAARDRLQAAIRTTRDQLLQELQVVFSLRGTAQTRKNEEMRDGPQ